MKTIRQIADEIGVSKQAVNQKIKKEPLATALRQLSATNGNTLYIEDSGADLIKSAFSESASDNKTTTNDNGIVEFLKEQLREKDRQLAEKDKQLEALTESVRIQAQSINAANHNELAETLNAAQTLIQQQTAGGGVAADEKEAAAPERKFFGLFQRKKQKIAP